MMVAPPSSLTSTQSNFYKETLETCIRSGYLQPEMTDLFVCSGEKDKDVFLSLGVTRVNISNLDEWIQGDHPFSPLVLFS